MTMYAITDHSYRAISSPDGLQPGEQLTDELPPALLESIAGIEVRAQRAILLRGSDWTQLPDAPLTADARAAWGVYRQALRDIPDQAGFPFVTWPQPPALQAGAGTETGEQS